MKTNLSSSGYTLIELMVVIAISAVLLLIGVAKYSDFNKTQTVKQAALKLKSDLREVRNKALAGEKDCTVAFCGGSTDGCGNDTSEKPLDGWYINLFSNSYAFYGHCGGTGGTDFSNNSISLPTNITLTWGLAGTNPLIKFKSLGQGVEVARTLCLTGFSKFYKLVITVSGEVQDGGFVVSCP